MCQCIAREDVLNSIAVALEEEVFDNPVQFDDDEQAPRRQHEGSFLPYGFQILKERREPHAGQRRPRR